FRSRRGGWCRPWAHLPSGSSGAASGVRRAGGGVGLGPAPAPHLPVAGEVEVVGPVVDDGRVAEVAVLGQFVVGGAGHGAVLLPAAAAVQFARLLEFDEPPQVLLVGGVGLGVEDVGEVLAPRLAGGLRRSEAQEGVPAAGVGPEAEDLPHGVVGEPDVAVEDGGAAVVGPQVPGRQELVGVAVLRVEPGGLDGGAGDVVALVVGVGDDDTHVVGVLAGEADGPVKDALTAQPREVLGGAEVVAPAGAVTSSDDDRARFGGRGLDELADGVHVAVLGGGQVPLVAGLVGVVLLARLGGGQVVEGVDAAGVADRLGAEQGLVGDQPGVVLESPAAEALVLGAACPPDVGAGDVDTGGCLRDGDVVAVGERGAGRVLLGACGGESAVLGVRQVHAPVGGGGFDCFDERCLFGQGVGVADDDDVVPAGLGAADDLVAAGGEAELLVPGVDLDQVGAGEEFAVAGDGEVVGLPAGGLGPPGDADEDSG